MSEAVAAVTVELAGPLDVAASVEFLRRNGDDLMDRWDGSRLVRVLTFDGRRVPVSMRPLGDATTPGLSATAAPGQDITVEELRAALAVQFILAGASWDHLLATDPRLAAVAATAPAIRPLGLTDPFYSLVRAITAQQVNLRFATTIRARLAQSFGVRVEVDGSEVYVLEPDTLAGASVAALRRLQLSERKASYLIGVASAVADGRIDQRELAGLETEELVRTMTRLHGVGRWTAEWFAARVFGRPVVVAGDVGLRKGVGRLYGVGMPSEDEVRRLTGHWQDDALIAQQLVLETCTRPVDRVAGD
ncbi:MAG: DNA-3-methyladenine glycosylase 2 family protein [Pseudonocardiales bacterium]|nr:DNA-3-methyladenine glycosylase 2 family protein [Pseudonocardiales bacterium]MBV9032802.1 DNA-3-methyladenine glycosylase 2 family protein [Pseudonocardiales bacterium]MBW0009229.1 DNA-3-methyladenine glycosylase 2 family protein [Pseudonocardiales bacterium]